MQLGDVERGEVVEVCLDLRPVLDRVAHRDEDVLDALAQERNRVQVPAPWPAAGQRHIHALTLDFQQADVLLKSGLHGVELFGNLVVECLDALAERGALLRWHAPDELHELRERALLRSVARPQLSQLAQMRLRLFEREPFRSRVHSKASEAFELSLERFTHGRNLCVVVNRFGTHTRVLSSSSLQLQAAGCGRFSIAVRACPARAANASGELAARSASALRSSSMPASVRPCMNCE